MLKEIVVLCILGGLLAACAPDERAPTEEEAETSLQETLVYIGTYTRSGSEGIYIYRLNPESGALTPVGVRGGVENPSFLAIHPNGRFLYSVAEVAEFSDLDSGGVAAFSIDPGNGLLNPLNQQPSMGRGPCHVSVDQTGKHVLVANYGGGSVASLPIREDGSLGEPSSSVKHEGSSVDPRRQKQPYAHSINPGPTGNLVFAADLGTDKIFIYQLNPETGVLTPHQVPSASVAPGSGPRHFTFSPDGRFAYVINEMLCTVTAFSYDPEEGSLTEIQTIPTLPEGTDLEGMSTAEVLVSPDGRFLYGSNRGHNSIVVFEISEEDGTLRFVERESTQGETPRNFGIDPSGRFLLAANQNSDSVVVFKIDPSSGGLEPTGTTIQVPTPVCVRFLENSKP